MFTGAVVLARYIWVSAIASFCDEVGLEKVECCPEAERYISSCSRRGGYTDSEECCYGLMFFSPLSQQTSDIDSAEGRRDTFLPNASFSNSTCYSICSHSHVLCCLVV